MCYDEFRDLAVNGSSNIFFIFTPAVQIEFPFFPLNVIPIKTSTLSMINDYSIIRILIKIIFFSFR